MNVSCLFRLPLPSFNGMPHRLDGSHDVVENFLCLIFRQASETSASGKNVYSFFAETVSRAPRELTRIVPLAFA